METITITHDDTPGGGRFLAQIAGEPATGELISQARSDASGPVMIATHTLVPGAIGGRGVAARLVEALVSEARARGARIEPACSYVAAAARRHPEWGDVML